jgi:hypothetical protein
MRRLIFLLIIIHITFVSSSQTQTPDQVIKKVREKLDKVNDYEASGTMKMNVTFIKAPIAHVKVYYKKPDKLKINNESGISLIPKGSVNISAGHIIANAGDFDMIDVGKEEKTGLRIIKLLPKNENADVVLSTFYIDETSSLIKRAKTTTKDNGTYELEMTYGRYAEYGLADKVIFSFNTKDYKLPKGVTFDYDDGTKKDPGSDPSKNKKGKIEIAYSSYLINKGVPDSVFK